MNALRILICVLVFTACSSTDESEKNLATARACFDAFNEHDWQKFSSYYTDDARFLDPSFGKDYVTKTRSETAAKYAELAKMFPDLHDHVVGMYASGDKVAVEFISTGMVSDSVKFSLPIVSILTFKNGLIVQDATYYDQENP